MNYDFERAFGKVRYTLTELDGFGEYPQIFFQPNRPFRVTDIRAEGEIEIDIVYIGNTIAKAFVKRHPLCSMGERITIQLKPRGFLYGSKIILIGDEE